MNKNKGFTLIELMITVAIIGILSLIAMPFYRDYVIRVRVTEALYEASSIQKKFLEIFFTEGQGSPAMNEMLYPGGLLATIQIDGKSAKSARLTNIVNIGSGTGWNYTAFGMEIMLQDDILPSGYNSYNNTITLMNYVSGYSYVDLSGTLHTIKGFGATETGDISLRTFCGQSGAPTDLANLKRKSLPRKWLPQGCRDGSVYLWPTPVVIQDGAINF
ncbi:pilin [Wohlfahrtiimonas populi]|uniref:pilin n=1 Tax=Wohlfahrtiimonas populi TaxID=1940240 RepID=UPI00098CF7B4|nr:prepilin-type N-terminal cleavage/methylation domain-containing protein [Wohlfahrtiimonas populi]